MTTSCRNNNNNLDGHCYTTLAVLFRSICKHFSGMFDLLSGSSLALLWQFAGSLLAVIWQFSGSSLAVIWQSSGSYLAIIWQKVFAEIE